MTKTCVILLNYNGEQDTRACLRSLAQSHASPFVVVVDNASEGFEDGPLRAAYADLYIIRNTENLGFGIGNNIGIDWAIENVDAEYLFILNNDTTLDGECIGVLEDFMDSRSAAAMCSPLIMRMDSPDRLWYGGGEIDWYRGGARIWNMHGAFDRDLEPKPVGFVSGCAMFFRKSTLLDGYRFDPRFFIYSEDVELCARLAEAGLSLYCVPGAVIYHRTHGSLRGDAIEFQRPFEAPNPKLAFYVEHAIFGSLLSWHLHARGRQRFVGLCYIMLRWTKRLAPALVAGRVEVLRAITRGVRRFKEAR